MSAQAALVGMLPEHLLLAGILLLVGAQILSLSPRVHLAVAFAALSGAVLAAGWLAGQGYTGEPFAGQYAVAPATTVAKLLLLALCVPVLVFSRDDFPRDDRFPVLLLSSAYGACLLLSAESFLGLFLGLEILSLPVYVLVLLGMRRPEGAEAALKYLVLGAAASAMLLMGAALLYAATGNLQIATFSAAVASPGPLELAALTLVLAAFFAKAAIVPFHTWAPDAYEGASLPSTAYMATVVKAAVVLATARLFAEAPLAEPVLVLLAVPALVSIVWGNLAAYRQHSVRRLIAWSSVAHAGYLFYALLGDGPGRFQAVLFYALVYALMNLLALVLLPAGPDETQRDRLDNLQGLWHRAPLAAVLIAIAMFSLAGIPPFPGFVAKFLVFRNVIEAGHTLYAVLGLLGSYLGIFFYLRVIQRMFMGSPGQVEGQGAPGPAAVVAGLLCLVPFVLLGFLPGWVLGLL